MIFNTILQEKEQMKKNNYNLKDSANKYGIINIGDKYAKKMVY